jgi:hypothetical protein
VPGVSTIDVVSGRISVAVDKSRMRPGEVVEIKTPNAVSGIRGTIVVAEVSGGVSTITVLRGLVDVYRRDPATGKAAGRATPVGARETVTVKAGVLPARPQPISVDQARRLSNDFTTPVQPVAPASTIVADEVSRATTLVGTLTGGTIAGGDTQSPGGDAASMKTDTATTAGEKGTRPAASAPVATPGLATLPTLTPTSPTTNAQPAANSPAPIVSTPILSTPILSTPAVTPPTPSSSGPLTILSPVLQPVNTLLKR